MSDYPKGKWMSTTMYAFVAVGTATLSGKVNGLALPRNNVVGCFMLPSCQEHFTVQLGQACCKTAVVQLSLASEIYEDMRFSWLGK